MDMETKLKRFRKDVLEAQTKFSKLEGERESILRRLKDEDGLSGVDGAKAYVKSQEVGKKELSGELDGVLHTLKADFGFD
jgi:hypothetical protein